MKIKEKLLKFKNIIVNALFPSDIKCIFCGCDIPSPYICDKCNQEEIYNNKNRCEKCDTPIKEGNLVCDHCKNKKRDFEKLYSPFIYDNYVRKALLQFKSDGAKYLGHAFARFIAERLILEQVEIDLIVAVPSHKDTIKKRGYNPAVVLAEELSKIMNIPFENILYKTRKTQNQKYLDYSERQVNLESSMILLNKSIVKNKNILIVDDIITTGATIEACAKLMPNAKNIYGCAFARRAI